MPHLHLPIDHTDADLVLAANLAEIVGSEDLYVAWSHESGPGAIPEVEAVMREQRLPARREFFAARRRRLRRPSGARCSAGRRPRRRARRDAPSEPAGRASVR